jgi:hypothetical protein
MKKYQGGGVPPMAGGAGGDGDGGGGGGDIDLGQQPEGVGMSDMPSGAAPAPPSGPMYPSVMLTGDEGLSKIPDEGRSIIHHKVTSRRIHTPEHGRHKGKTRHEVEMQVQKIRPIRGYKKAPSKSKVSDDETAMKKLLGDQEEEE